MTRRRTRALARFLSGVVAVGLLLPTAAASFAAGNVIDLVLTTDTASVAPGGSFTVTATLSNTSGATSTQVELRAPIPSNGTALAVVSQKPDACRPSGTQLICSLSNLPAGKSHSDLVFKFATPAGEAGHFIYDWEATAKQRTVSGQQTGADRESGSVSVSSRDDQSVIIQFEGNQPFTFGTEQADGENNRESGKATVPYNPAVEGQRGRICEWPTATSCARESDASTASDACGSAPFGCLSSLFVVTIPGDYGTPTVPSYLMLDFTMSRSQLPTGLVPELVDMYKRDGTGNLVALPDCVNGAPPPDQHACELERTPVAGNVATFTLTVLTTRNGEYRAG